MLKCYYSDPKKLQRSLSRKGSQRVGDRKINGLTTLQIHDNKDVLSAMCSPIGTISLPKHTNYLYILLQAFLLLHIVKSTLKKSVVSYAATTINFNQLIM
jgi:hypothetical protein